MSLIEGEMLNRMISHPLQTGFTTIDFEHNGRVYSYRRYSLDDSARGNLALLPVANDEWIVCLESQIGHFPLGEIVNLESVVVLAGARLGELSEYVWQSIIAPVKFTSGSLRLSHDLQLNDLNIRASVTSYERYQWSFRNRSFGGGGMIETLHPSLVTGRVVGSDGVTRQSESNRTVLELAAALTLLTGVYWEVLIPPRGSTIDLNQLPTREMGLPLLGESSGSAIAGVNIEQKSLGVIIESMRVNKRNNALMAGFYHGYEIEQIGPSMACVAYVAIIEAIGKRLASMNKSEDWGSKRAYKEALKLVLSADEAKRLGALYGLRSSTAHEMKLHSTEFRLGAVVNTFRRDEPGSFLYSQVWHLREAARRLLELTLLDRLPGFESSS
ncbi:hypothetical protein F8O01_15350 [Pseudoclavibacter chungangensis]|uniref:Apea-like HEPN domain-containing protein n=1 Tax=Pseudoclavibacter chungangensis TaxID=587635 RepID=A0A7J5BNE7_9MICO|nr:hypothetical protein [Pseudoclavibacter chungangensis]KAB1653443.1 hypothetical protein F8O01_15350 [Pseudoclavibacter chungangensis]NYJ66379.1 hypothetical protein [Pseudoclavibacter chungangensis]